MKNLLDNQKTLIISSLDGLNNPKISYSPYVFINDKLYIYISKVADHYDNIINNENISVMIIEDEKDSKTSFARNRVSFNCTAKRIEDDENILNVFREKHDKSIMNILVKLDFSIFELNIMGGRLVKGFGQAFDISSAQDGLQTTQVIIEKHKHK